MGGGRGVRRYNEDFDFIFHQNLHESHGGQARVVCICNSISMILAQTVIIRY